MSDCRCYRKILVSDFAFFMYIAEGGLLENVPNTGRVCEGNALSYVRNSYKLLSMINLADLEL